VSRVPCVVVEGQRYHARRDGLTRLGYVHVVLEREERDRVYDADDRAIGRGRRRTRWRGRWRGRWFRRRRRGRRRRLRRRRRRCSPGWKGWKRADARTCAGDAQTSAARVQECAEFAADTVPGVGPLLHPEYVHLFFRIEHKVPVGLEDQHPCWRTGRPSLVQNNAPARVELDHVVVLAEAEHVARIVDEQVARVQSRGGIPVIGVREIATQVGPEVVARRDRRWRRWWWWRGWHGRRGRRRRGRRRQG
jgi:hypothetical protein